MRGIEERVYAVLKRYYDVHKRGLSVRELHSMLIAEGVGISERGLREVLKRLMRRGYVKEIKGWPRRYIPSKDVRMFHVRPITEFIRSMGTSEEISGKVELEESEFTLKVAQYLYNYLKEHPRILDLVRNNYSLIADLNPRESALELLDYLCRSVMNATSGGKSGSIIMQTERVMRRYYSSVLGIPTTDLVNPKIIEKYSVDELCGHAGDDVLGSVAAIAFSIRGSTDGTGITVIMAYNEDRVKSFLNRRILADRLAYKVPVKNQSDFYYISGHDSSYWPIVLDPSIVSNHHGFPVSTELYILSGIRYSTWRARRGLEIKYVPEIEPHPQTFPELEKHSAVYRGYLITPEMIEDSGGKGSRLVEASMNILEYTMMLEDIEGIRSKLRGKIEDKSGYLDVLSMESIYEENPPRVAPRPVFHDGRLFPYEHKLSDFDEGYGHWHVTLVRQSISVFRNLVRAVMGDRRLLIVGVVKRAHAPYIHPLIIWGLRKAGVLTEGEFWRYLTYWIYERFEVNALFRGLKNEIESPDETYVTFPLIRRFWSMDRKYMDALLRTEGADDKSEYSQEFWLEKAIFSAEQPKILPPGLRGYLSRFTIQAGDDEILSYVLANASVALTYVMPPIKYVNLDVDRRMGIFVVIPRYEVLVQPISSFGFDTEAYGEYVRKCIGELALPKIPEIPKNGVLYKYEVADIWEKFTYHTHRITTILPYHIYKADEYARRYDDELKKFYYNELVKALSKLISNEKNPKD